MLLKLLIGREGEVVSEKTFFKCGYDIMPSTRTIDNFILAFETFEQDPKNQTFPFYSRGGLQFES